ncbi:tyrosine-type recombinase/integrase [Streptomyces sp. NPDC057555]|uniref:tyrosine-type recombinase/integrase n=1 Tax=Streptomyces sp. NPDC057555 TaxID=3346166 RepID=UPI0036C05561
MPVSPNLAKRVGTTCVTSLRSSARSRGAIRGRRRASWKRDSANRSPSGWFESTSQGKCVNYSTWNKRSWRPALAAASVLKIIGEKAETHGGRTRRYPVYELSREDMFHALRHTFASAQLEAGESLVSVAEWLGHASPQTTLKHYAKPRKLHQTGEKPQVARQSMARSGLYPPTT